MNSQRTDRQILEHIEDRIDALASRRALTVDEIDDAIKLLERNIDELRLTSRTANCLIEAGLTSIRQIAHLTRSDLLKTANLGRKSTDEVLEALARRQIRLRAGEYLPMWNLEQ